jgi:hypothetical protein
MTDVIASIGSALLPSLGTLAGSLASSLFGNNNNKASTVGVGNTAPLVFNAAKQAGQNAAVDVENRYGSLGLGNSTMASLDASQAKGYPFVGAASGIANLDLNAQEFNADKAFQYQQQQQNQMTGLQNELASFLGGQQGQATGQQASQVTDPSAFTPGG